MGKNKTDFLKFTIMNLPAAVHDNGHQVVHAVGVGGVPRRVEKAELQREDDAIGQLGVAVQLVHVLKALQVQGEDHRQLFYSHPEGKKMYKYMYS